MNDSLKDSLGASLSSSLKKAQESPEQEDGESQIEAKRSGRIRSWFRKRSNWVSDNPFVMGFMASDDDDALW